MDAHGAEDDHRLSDAFTLVAALAEIGINGYIARSRGGRGHHAYVLFDEPGASQAALHRLLSLLAAELAPADVFPSAPSGIGRAIFLPGFNGAPLLDGDAHPVDLSRIELDDPALLAEALGGNAGSRQLAIPTRPKWWRSPALPGGGAAPLDEQLTFFGPSGLRNARRGARNSVAGTAARAIVRRGGTFEDFIRWDTENHPPLAADEPKQLQRWWKWATRTRQYEPQRRQVR